MNIYELIVNLRKFSISFIKKFLTRSQFTFAAYEVKPDLGLLFVNRHVSFTSFRVKGQTLGFNDTSLILLVF